MDATSLQILACKDTQSSVNSLSVGETPNVLVAGQSGGHVAVFKVGSAAADKFSLDLVKEARPTTKNISKVIRTTRNDFALGTESGVVFCAFKPPDSFNFTLV